MSDEENPDKYREILSKGISSNITKNKKISEILSVILTKLNSLAPPKNSDLN